MIIGNNSNNNSNNNFINPGNNRYGINPEQQNQNPINNNIKQTFVSDIKTTAHVNPVNKNDMSDKTLAMLHERYTNGLITLDEFNKQCNILGQKRQK